MKFTNIFSRLLAVFGIVFIFSVSGWGASYASFSINNVSQPEGSTTGSMTFAITISGYCRKNTTYTVNWATADNTAKAGTDYTTSSGIANYTQGNNTNSSGTCGSINITIPTLGGTAITSSRQFYINLTNATPTSGSYQANISDAQGIGTITPPPLPVVTSSQSFNVSSGATAGTQIGTVATTGGTPTNFSIASGNTDNIFSIDHSGLISVASTVPTTPTSYTLSVTATNFAGTSTAQNVTIIVLPNFTCANPKPFTPIFSTNVSGKLVMIGNTSLCYNVNGQCSDPGTKNNNDINMMNNDYDNVFGTNDYATTTVNSSAAQLVMPTGKKVLWAGLFWQGYMVGWTNAQKATGQQIKYKWETDSYHVVNNAQMNWVYFDSSRMYYESYVDITSYVNAHGAGYYWVGDLATSTGQPTGGSFGAWSLAVVYQDDAENFSNITVYDGYQAIAGSADVTNALSYAQSNGCSTSNTGLGSQVSSTLSGFLTPSSGTVNSSFSVFAGEGDISLTGDSGTITDKTGTAHYLTNALNPSNNIMNSTISNNGVTVTTGRPYYSPNSLGADIDTYDTSGIMSNQQTSTTITLSTTGDGYMPGMYAISTQLYLPSLCYYQSFFDANGNILSNPKKGDTITVATWLSNMQKGSNSNNLDTALNVQVGMALDTTNLQYVAESTKIKNIGDINYTTKTDINDSDLATFNTNTSSANWSLGLGATSTSGGTFYPNPTGSNSSKAYVTYQAKIEQDGNISVNNLYTVSFVNGTTLAYTSNAPLKLCADINTSIGVVPAALGNFNVVNQSFTGTTDPTSSTDSLNALPTQIVGKPFQVQVLSLATDNQTLQAYTDNDVNVTMIATPDYSTCTDDTCKTNACKAAVPLTSWYPVNFNNSSSVLMSFTYSKAIKNASFKIQQGSGTNAVYVCSRDVFAVRPDRFILTAPTGQDIGLLKSGIVYNFSLLAAQYNSSLQSLDYNVSGITNTNGLLSLNPTLYNIHGNPDSTLHGTLSLSTNSFDIQNGLATNVVDMSFDDVAKVDMQVIDKTWAQVDITNGDTPANCTGAWICGDTNATFIPDHFALSGVGLYNNNNTGFTYLSDDLNMSARVGLTVTAQNALSATTQNFSSGSWENPVNIYLTVPTISGLTSIKHDINSTIDLGFNHGALTIPWNETNSSQQLLFNFKRDVNSPKNPFVVLGSNIDLNSSSLYTSSSSNTANISGSNVATQDATFLYGRTFAPRYRFTGNNGNANIFYEAYCGSDGNKSMLPTGSIGDSSSIGWYLNVNHNAATDGNITAIVEKNLTNTVTNSSTLPLTTSNGVSTATLIYHGTTFPYKTTMQDAASSWLIYNPDNSNATTNDFQVEFYGGSNNWTGHNNNTTTTDSVAAPVTSKRILW